MNGNGQPSPSPTAPTFPWEVGVNTPAFYFEPRPDGGMDLVFAPAVPGPAGWSAIPPGIRVRFGPEGWKRFQTAVAADGKVSRIAVASALPDPPRRAA